MRRAGFLVTVTLLAVVSARASDFRVVRLESPGRINQRIVSDLDGDGHRDILLFSGHRMVLHLGSAKAGYTEKPTVQCDFEPTGLVFCLGDVDDDPKTTEVVFLRRGGAGYYAFHDGRFDPTPRTLLEAEGLVTWGQRDDVHWRHIVEDLDEDGFVDLIFPTRTGYRLVLGKAHGTKPRYSLEGAVEIRYPLSTAISVGGRRLLDRTTYAEGIPDWSTGDFDGDGRIDFVLLREGRIEVHRGTKDGFSATSNFWLDLRELRGEKGLIQPTMHDVNRDGIPDLMANEPWQGRTTIFLGRKIEGTGRIELPPPAVTRRVSGWSWEPRIEDLDGDGWPDLILPTTEKVGALEAAAVVVSGRLGVRNFIYLNTRDPEHPYREEADAIREIEVEIRLSLDITGQVKIGHTKIVSTRADFDGDGRNDLLLQTDDDELAVYRGRREGVIAQDAWRRLSIPSTAEDKTTRHHVADLDGNGSMDILLHYQSWERDRDRIVVLFARKD